MCVSTCMYQHNCVYALHIHTYMHKYTHVHTYIHTCTCTCMCICYIHDHGSLRQSRQREIVTNNKEQQEITRNSEKQWHHFIRNPHFLHNITFLTKDCAKKRKKTPLRGMQHNGVRIWVQNQESHSLILSNNPYPIKSDEKDNLSDYFQLP